MEPTPRGRDEGSGKDVDLVCLEEIGVAARALAAAQLGMSREDLIAQTAKTLGFAATLRAKVRVGEAIDREIKHGRLHAGPPDRIEVTAPPTGAGAVVKKPRG